MKNLLFVYLFILSCSSIGTAQVKESLVWNEADSICVLDTGHTLPSCDCKECPFCAYYHFTQHNVIIDNGEGVQELCFKGRIGDYTLLEFYDQLTGQMKMILYNEYLIKESAWFDGEADSVLMATVDLEGFEVFGRYNWQNSRVKWLNEPQKLHRLTANGFGCREYHKKVRQPIEGYAESIKKDTFSLLEGLYPDSNWNLVLLKIWDDANTAGIFLPGESCKVIPLQGEHLNKLKSVRAKKTHSESGGGQVFLLVMEGDTVRFQLDLLLYEDGVAFQSQDWGKVELLDTQVFYELIRKR